MVVQYLERANEILFRGGLHRHDIAPALYPATHRVGVDRELSTLLNSANDCNMRIVVPLRTPRMIRSRARTGFGSAEEPKV